MDKREVAQYFAELAGILELDGANPFKVRAYENAARIVEGLTDDLDRLVRDDELVKIKGIGRNIADHIAELIKTGGVKEYDKLIRGVPEGVKRMLVIPGLGPKKVRHLWKDLGLKTIGELEIYCKRHMLEEEPGFGRKTEEKILQGIKMIKRFAGKRRFDEAFEWAAVVHAEVLSWPETIRSDVGGSIRRRKEIVKDIDIIVATDDPDGVMKRFVSMDTVERVVENGKTKSEVILSSGIQCDLRAVSDAQYAFALHHFTGSKEHNVAMRTIARESGLKLNEYGIFKGQSKKTIPCKDEADLFGVFELDYIPPELRENMGEIEAAREHRLPDLVKDEDLRGVIHAHTTYTDGEATIEEMAMASKERGYEYLVLADHSQAVTIAGGMKPAEVKKQHREIERLNKKLAGFTIFKGIEVDILADGSLDYDDDLLATFDLVIAAIHSRFGMSEKEMTERIAKGVSNPHVDILAHPTGRLLLARDPYALDLRRVIDVCAEHGTALEINAHPQRLDLDWRWCKYARDHGCRFSIAPDAHDVEDIDNMVYGVGVARKGWLEKDDILNCLTADQLARRIRK